MDTIQKFTMLLWQDFINLLHLFDGHSSDDHIRKYSKEIRENGIISIGNYLDESFCDQLRNEIEGFAADYSSGVRYIPKGKCPDGYKNKGDGCYQVCKSCNYSEKLIEKVLYSEESKELLNEDAFNYAVTDVDWDLNQNGELIE